MQQEKVTIEQLSKRKTWRSCKNNGKGKKYPSNTKYKEGWHKENTYQYQLVLSIYNEPELILYIDSLESLKPYLVKLIRKEMENPYINRKARYRQFASSTASGRTDKKRLIGIRFSKNKDADVIAYLKTKESIRAYLIGLLEQDMIDTGYVLPPGIKEYSKENKRKIKNIRRRMYSSIYRYIEEKIKNGEEIITYTELFEHVKGDVDSNICPKTYSSYRRSMFSQTGVLKAVSKGAYFEINKEKFRQLEEPYILWFSKIFHNFPSIFVQCGIILM